MTQKERLLTFLCRKLMGKAIFPNKNSNEMYEQTKQENIEVGDLIMCSTSGVHNWTIGFLVEKYSWVIKEIDGDRLCNITNDSFMKIPKEWIPDEYLLTSEEYKIYEKCIKAIKRCKYGTLYKGISFDGKICKLDCRQKWSADIWKHVEFVCNSKTTIKSIASLIENTTENEIKMFE